MFTELMASGSGGGGFKTITKELICSTTQSTWTITADGLTEIYSVLIEQGSSSDAVVVGAMKDGDSYTYGNLQYYHIDNITGNQITFYSYGARTYNVHVMGN